ncbi:MAG TPA: DUF4336 domain-containing protein [Devosiaceae bacterium]
MVGQVDLYEPTSTLKPVAANVWIVDGPAIDFGPGPFHVPFPTRMTIVRLPGGRLFVHSPTELTRDMVEEISAIGTVFWLIAPNRIHHWWMPQWHKAYPYAEVFVAPRVKQAARGRLDFPLNVINGRGDYPWAERIDTFAAVGDFMTELIFFDRMTRTLILTDLIENFEQKRVHPGWMRWLIRAGGVADPDGQMPRDMRIGFWRRRDRLRALIGDLIALDPERVIIAHGRWYERNGAAELRRAFRWLLR